MATNLNSKVHIFIGVMEMLSRKPVQRGKKVGARLRREPIGMAQHELNLLESVRKRPGVNSYADAARRILTRGSSSSLHVDMLKAIMSKRYPEAFVARMVRDRKLI